MTTTPAPPSRTGAAGAAGHRRPHPAPTADPRVDVIARARGRSLWMARHTPAGASAWASWRLEVASILHDADLLAQSSAQDPLDAPQDPPSADQPHAGAGAVTCAVDELTSVGLAPLGLTVGEALTRARTIRLAVAALAEVGDDAGAAVVASLEANDPITGRLRTVAPATLHAPEATSLSREEQEHLAKVLPLLPLGGRRAAREDS